jgi:hypothetical protein
LETLDETKGVEQEDEVDVSWSGTLWTWVGCHEKNYTYIENEYGGTYVSIGGKGPGPVLWEGGVNILKKYMYTEWSWREPVPSLGVP